MATPVKPQFGAQLGFWYPLVWRILSLNRFFSPSMWLPNKSGLAIDVYVTLWWALELGVAVFANDAGRVQAHRTAAIGAVALASFRLVDVFFVLFSILLKGYYRRASDWLSGNRIMLFTILNALEIMVLFGLLFFLAAHVWPTAAAVRPEFPDLFDAMFLSVATGTTLGYGTPVPTGPLSKLLSMMETLFVLLVVVVLISHVRARGETPRDLEQEDAAN